MKILSIIALVMAANAYALPVKLEKASPEMTFTNDVIFKMGNYVVKKTDKVGFASIDDYYVVNTQNWFTPPHFLPQFAEIVDFAPGHFAVVRLKEENIEKLSGYLHHHGWACGGLIKLRNRPVFLGEVLTPEPIIPVDTRDAQVESLASKVQASQIEDTVTFLSSMHTRHHGSSTGRQVAGLLADRYRELAGSRDDVSISFFNHSGTSQNSLVVRIEGQDSPDEVIVVGSHIDSISFWNGQAPGADDNASGTATNMEIFRVLMENNVRLSRTLEIHGYAAEEIGLVGSDEIAEKYRRDRVNVIAMLQNDMNLYSSGQNKIYLISNDTHSGFNNGLNSLARNYSGLPVGSASLSGGTSDHRSWTSQGYAAAFPFENPSNYNNYIHTANDTISNSGNFEQSAGFAKLGLSFVLHYGGRM